MQRYSVPKLLGGGFTVYIINYTWNPYILSYVSDISNTFLRREICCLRKRHLSHYSTVSSPFLIRLSYSFIVLFCFDHFLSSRTDISVILCSVWWKYRDLESNQLKFN